MARSKPISIGARGSCCRQYQGREGFWFEKNVARLKREWPSAFRSSTIRERCVDALGRPATTKAVALEYCLRRCNEINRQVEGLKEGPKALSPDDVATTGTALANNVAETIRNTIPLDNFDAVKIKGLSEWQRWQEEPPVDLLLENPDANWGELLDWLSDPDLDAIHNAFDKGLAVSGLNLKAESTNAARAAYSHALQRWAGEALLAQQAGSTKAPKPKGIKRAISIDALCELSVKKSWHAKSTIAGVRNALKKLMTWAENHHGIKMLASLQPDHLREYSSALYEIQPRSARKDLGYLISIYNCGIQYNVLPDPSPCVGIIRPKREHRRRRAKTVDDNKSMSAEELSRLDNEMARDPQFDIYLIQRFTGARQQEVAGLRQCDFVIKNGHRCIAIWPHEKRGMGTEGDEGGIKTQNSIRFIPLPAALDQLWKRHHSKCNTQAFERTSKERHFGENYRRRQWDAAKRVAVPSGTHAMRHTIHQTLIDDGINPEVVKMITGKMLSISDYLHANIDNMKLALERFEELRPLATNQAPLKAACLMTR